MHILQAYTIYGTLLVVVSAESGNYEIKDRSVVDRSWTGPRLGTWRVRSATKAEALAACLEAENRFETSDGWKQRWDALHPTDQKLGKPTPTFAELKARKAAQEAKHAAFRQRSNELWKTRE